MRTQRLALTILAPLSLALVLGAASSADASPKCRAAMLKCVGKLASGALGCFGKQSTKPVTLCFQPFDKFSHPADGKGCIDKLEAKVDCLTPGHGLPLGRLFERLVGEPTGLGGGVLDALRAPGGPSKCDATKLKCSGKNMAARLGCYAKAETAGSIDPACLAKADAGLEKCFTKADGYGDCSVSATAGAIEALIGTAVDQLGVAPKRCAATGVACTADEDCAATNLTGVCLTNGISSDCFYAPLDAAPTFGTCDLVGGGTTVVSEPVSEGACPLFSIGRDAQGLGAAWCNASSGGTATFLCDNAAVAGCSSSADCTVPAANFCL